MSLLHASLGALAAFISIGATVPYLISIMRRRTRPNTVSWFLWIFTVGIIICAQVSAGPSWSLLLLAGSMTSNLAVLALCLWGYGYKRFDLTDRLCFALSVCAIALWLLTSSPVAAIVLAVAADGIAYVPTFFKTWREPSSEDLLYWSLLVVADVLAALASTQLNLANLLYPISYGILNGIVAALILRRRPARLQP